jgi:tetratricopeptide (TPR) repeat protein
VSFWSLAEIVKAQAGILDGDSEAETTAKLDRTVEEVVTEDRDWVLRHLKPVVGLGGDADEAAEGERFTAWRAFFEELAARRPLVLVFEDLHWADDGLLNFVDHLAEWASEVPLLLVGTARPELIERRPAWGGGKLNATTLALAPLAEGEIAQIIHSLLERPVLEASHQETLLSRAGGNPLYAEQYARMVIERSELTDLAVPENVQGIIAARIDGLSQEEKQVLQHASVLGKVFWTGALEALDTHPAENLDALLHGLERKDFVHRARRSSVAGSTEYAFRHVLVRDVAYGQIPRSDRSTKHRRVAEWLESLGRPEDNAELVAHHYVSALELARSAGQSTAELEKHARIALVAAADRAAALNAFDRAVPFYRDALELWPAAEPRRPYLLLELGRAQWLTMQTGADVLAEAVDGLLSAGDRGWAADAETLLASLALHDGNGAAVRRHLERAEDLVRDLPPSRATASVLKELARLAWVSGAAVRATELAADALAIAELLGLAGIRSNALNTRGVARVFLGDYDGLEDLEASLELALELKSVMDILRGYNNLAHAALMLGDARRYHELHLENLRLAEKLGARDAFRWTLGNLILGYFDRGEWDEAVRLADDMIAEVESGLPIAQEYNCRAVRGEIRLARGDEAGALADIERAVASMRTAGSSFLVSGLLRYARMLNATGRTDDANDVFDEVMTAIENLGDPEISHVSYVARALGREIEVSAALERYLAGRAETRWLKVTRTFLGGDLVGAADLLAEIGNLAMEAYVRFAAAKDLVERGLRHEADEQLQKALAFWRSVGATRYIREGEALLAATA